VRARAKVMRRELGERLRRRGFGGSTATYVPTTPRGKRPTLSRVVISHRPSLTRCQAVSCSENTEIVNLDPSGGATRAGCIGLNRVDGSSALLLSLVS
jgi:hypothetical protein